MEVGLKPRWFKFRACARFYWKTISKGTKLVAECDWSRDMRDWIGWVKTALKV